MKCIKNVITSKIKRVKNEEAEKLIQNNDWKYISKKEWKENVRDKK